MYYRLSDSVALRSWKYVDYACYLKNESFARRLSKTEFETAMLCDGEHDLKETETVKLLLKDRMIVACNKGDRLSDWSVYKEYPNRYFPRMSIMLTGKCNYNCLHCFNAADNAPLSSEWEYEDLLDLLDQADECGIHALTLTGGEPMLHPHFLDILREIYRRNMMVFEINTNGYYITPRILDEMKALGCSPLIKISFDGIGCHDTIRGHKGAEQKTLDAIGLCKKYRFRVEAQTQVNKLTLPSLIPTARLLDEMGVDIMRLLRTTEVARLEKTSPGIVIPMEDYYDEMIRFAGEYAKSGINMKLYIWMLANLYPDRKNYSIIPVKSLPENFSPTSPICRDIRSMIGIASDGEVAPCLQMTGTMTERAVHFANVHDTKLSTILSEGPYFDMVCCNMYKFKENTPKCASCRHFKYCSGGCPAFSMLYSDKKADYFNPDVTKCLFWDNGFYERITEIMGDDWINLTKIR